MQENFQSSSKENIKSKGGVAPFGYVWRDGKLVVEKDEARVRKLIYELFLKHKRKKTVANILNESGYRTRKGAKFSDTTIDRLLRDTTAKGIKLIDEKEIKVESIIDEDIWQRVNNILGEKQVKQSNHLFSGLVFCICKTKMLVSNNQKNFICKKCKNKIEKTILEEAFLFQLENSSSSQKNQKFSGNIKKLRSQSSPIDFWQYLTKREKQILIENLINRIQIQKHTILIEFGIEPNSLFKAAGNGQQYSEATKAQETRENEENNSQADEPLMSEKEAAAFLGISKMTLMRRRKANKIAYYRVGFRILYSKEKHLLPFLEKCEK